MEIMIGYWFASTESLRMTDLLLRKSTMQQYLQIFKNPAAHSARLAYRSRLEYAGEWLSAHVAIAWCLPKYNCRRASKNVNKQSFIEIVLLKKSFNGIRSDDRDSHRTRSYVRYSGRGIP
ncbi:hypothetical protein TNCV_2805611 [Trichonephila clavipes]|nr:hypothetical protein TNCV_2805611 [Trichonephila clavipes]